jgi:hypothetical protein
MPLAELIAYIVFLKIKYFICFIKQPRLSFPVFEKFWWRSMVELRSTKTNKVLFVSELNPRVRLLSAFQIFGQRCLNAAFSTLENARFSPAWWP